MPVQTPCTSFPSHYCITVSGERVAMQRVQMRLTQSCLMRIQTWAIRLMTQCGNTDNKGKTLCQWLAVPIPPHPECQYGQDSLNQDKSSPSRIRNRYNEKPIDLTPPNPPAGSDDEQVRAAIRAAAAEHAVAAKGDIADGTC